MVPGRSVRVAGESGADGPRLFFVASCLSNRFELPGKPYAVRDLRRKPDFIVGRFSENGVVAGRQNHLFAFALTSGAFLRFTLVCPGNHSTAIHRAISIRLESEARAPCCQREEVPPPDAGERQLVCGAAASIGDANFPIFTSKTSTRVGLRADRWVCHAYW